MKTRENLKKKQRKAANAGLPIPTGEAPYEEPNYQISPHADGTLRYAILPAPLPPLFPFLRGEPHRFFACLMRSFAGARAD